MHDKIMVRVSGSSNNEEAEKGRKKTKMILSHGP